MIFSQCKGFACRIIIGLLIGFSVPAAAIAADERGESLIGNTITVGSELDYPPYADVDEEGNADGFSVDLIKAAAKQVGINLKFEVGPWAEVKAKLERGEIDALPLVAYSTEREKYFDFTRPHIVSHAVAFIRKGESRFQTIDDLRGKEVIVMRSDSTHEYVKFSAITDKITLTRTVGDSFKLLASGEHDFVIAPKLSGLLLLNELGIDNVEPFGEPLEAYGKGYSFAVHEGDTELLALLDRGLVLVRASGEYNQIYDKWFGHVDPQQQYSEELIRYFLSVALIVGIMILLVFIWNVSLRKKVNQKAAELKESETRFEATFAETAMGMAHVAPDGSWLRVNQSLCDMVGYSEDELLRLTFQDITHPDDLNSDLHFVEQMLSGEIENYSMEKRYFRKDGSIIWVNLTVSLVLKDNGEADYFISAVEDISRRKELDELLKMERNQAQRYLDVAGVMMIALNTSGEITLVNKKGLGILGYQEDEMIGKDWFNLCLPEDTRDQVKLIFRQLMSGVADYVEYYENQVVTKNGDLRALAFHNTFLRDNEGNITGVLSSGEDITDRNRAEQTIQTLVETTSRYVGEEFFKASVSNLQQWMGADAVILSELVDSEHVRALCMRVDDDFVDHYTYALGDTPCANVINHGYSCYNENAMQLFPKDEGLARMQIEGYIGEPLKNKEGKTLGLLCALSKNKNQFPEHAEDVMKIVAARAASELERSQAVAKLDKLSRAVEQAGEAVVITDAEGTIEYVNSAFSRITGYSDVEVIGQNPRLLKSDKHDDAFYEAMWKRLTDGKVWQGRVIDKRKDGSLYPAMVTISPLKNSDGVITHYVGVQQSLKKYEDLEKQFHQSQKMEAIGTLVGGIAHDFNNTLAGITSNLYLAKQKSNQLEVKAKIGSAEKLSFSAAATIQQLLTFSRKGVVNMSSILITPFLKEVIKLHRISIPENIALVQNIEEIDMHINGDINQLQQAMMNLINNARDAVEHVPSPEIQVLLSHESVQATGEFQPERVKTGEYVCISVLDNGSGISDDHIEHIFEPFYTTKEAGKGTGLGLSMVYGAIKTHGGWIFASHREHGVGTCMKIYLPLADIDPEQNVGLATDEVLEGDGETILLVDDNQMVLEVGKEVLEGLNYRVLTATDGVEAIEVYSEHGQEIDLLLLDVVMPRLGGMEALKEIRQSNPDVKVLFATGYNKANAVAGSNEFQTERVISKPFAISELSQEIRNKLNS